MSTKITDEDYEELKRRHLARIRSLNLMSGVVITLGRLLILDQNGYEQAWDDLDESFDSAYKLWAEIRMEYHSW